MGDHPLDNTIESKMLEMLTARGAGKSICPSEVARAVVAASDGETPSRAAWQPLMEPVRAVARRLSAVGRIVITQHGRPVDPWNAKGPIRFQFREQTDAPADSQAAIPRPPQSKHFMSETAANSKKSTAKKSTTRKQSAGKTAASQASAKKRITGTKKKQNCWPGYEPVPGKKPGTKGSCKPIPGEHSPSTRRATQRFAAASKLEKQGKPNPHNSE